MVFHAGAYATPERLVRRGISLEGAGPQGYVISHHAGRRILRRENLVVETTFVKIHLRRGRRPGKEVTCQLEHVVGVTGLGAGGSEMLGKMLDGKEGFSIAIAPNNIRVMVCHAVPKEAGDILVALLAG